MDYLKNAKDYLKKIDEVIANGKYKDDWKSLNNHKVPDWYRNAKFGIFMHWGVYSVPAFGSEWYPFAMYKKGYDQRGKNIYQYHIDTYGDHKDFGYRDFVPMFKAEKFDAKQWIDLFEEAGARFVTPVAEHCDGFQMYDSNLSDWCVSKKGPMKDTFGMLKKAVEDKGMTFCASSHRMEHYWFMGGMREMGLVDDIPYGDMYWPSYPSIFELEDGTKTRDFCTIDLINTDELFFEDWLARTCEIVDKYRPKIMYFDWWIQIKPMKPYLKKFAAYYYNRALEWGEEVTINYKNDAFSHTVGVKDIERGQLTDVSPWFWQNDTAVAKNSWCYTVDNEYKEVSEILCTLIDVVSKNGSLLLNVGPKSDGTISEEDANVLRGVGKWLKVNGEAIYDTYPWRKYGEGPTKTAEGHFSDMNYNGYSNDDYRFTYKDGDLYVFALNLAKDGVARIKTLGSQKHGQFNAVIKDIQVLGKGSVDYTLCDEYLSVQCGKKVDNNPVCIKMISEYF